MTRAIKRLARLAMLLIGPIVALVFFATLVRRHGDMPWTPLDLGAPLGSFTMSKLAALSTDIPHCRALIARAGVPYNSFADRVVSAECGYIGAVRLNEGGARQTALAPAGVPLSCPLAAAELMWEWDVVGPTAIMVLGSPVVAIRNLGSYNCRRLYGRVEGPFSEHARANAVDIAGFVLADGRSISVAKDWHGKGAKAQFLHAVRDGACRAFATVLSPDYNAAHADHLHLDQARRGAFGSAACR